MEQIPVSNENIEKKAEAESALTLFTLALQQSENTDLVDLTERSSIDPRKTQYEVLDERLAKLRYYLNYLPKESLENTNNSIMRAEIYIAAYRPSQTTTEEGSPTYEHEQ